MRGNTMKTNCTIHNPALCSLIGCLLMAVALCSAYRASAQCDPCSYLSPNLVVNGNFSQGNTGFSSDYNYATMNGPWGLLSFEGVYVVGSNANTFHTFFQGFDHTNPPTGQYMIVNGSGVPNTNVWCQTITVTPNTWYSFSAWARNVDTNPNNNVYANLQFNINGVPLGPSTVISGGWQPFEEEWFSGANTVIEICLVNNQTNGGGNDFGIDDIAFTTCIPYNVVTNPSAGNDATICSGEQITLGEPAFTNFNYSWSGTGVNGSGSATPSVTLTNNGTTPFNHVFTLTTDSANTGCIQTDQVTITVNPNPTVDLGPEQIICVGEDTELNAGNGWEQVVWSTGETTSSIIVNTPGTYTATVTLLDCDASDQVLVSTPPLPNISLGPDTSICADQEFTFGSGGAAGLWSTGSTATSISVNTPGWYWFQVENLGCTRRDSVFLALIQYPVVNLEPYVEICPGDSHTFYAAQEGLWSTGAQADSLVVSAPGFYSVILNNQQCAVADDSEVVLLDLPFVDLGPDRELCMPAQVRLNVAGIGNDAVLWSDGTLEFERTITETGVYGVVVSNVCDIAEDEIMIIIDDCDYGMYLPNAFTPDGDGLNEVWLPVVLNLESFRVVVYNRWGEEVWSTETEGEFWNGSHQQGGYFVSDNVYAYRGVGMSIQGKPVEVAGSIVVLR